MRNWLTSGLLATAIAGTALGQEFADQNGTIQPAGPRQGSSGAAFLNIEGSANGSFASYGVVRWDLSATKGALDLALGAGNWEVCKVELVLTQSNAGFTTDGPVQIFYTADDATDITSTFPTSPLQYPFITAGVPDLAVSLGDPVLNYQFIEVVTGQRDRHLLFAQGDTGARAAMANDIENSGDSTLTLVLNEDVNDPNSATLAATYAGATNTSQPAPELVITAALIGSGCPPVANAGPDQTLTDNDQNQTQIFTLDGSGSSALTGTITNYTWKEGVTTLASGASPTANVAFGLGVHTVTLTVTDSNAKTANDTVVITLVPGGTPPFVDAGAHQEVTDSDGNGTQNVALDGSNSADSDGTIVSYTWVDRLTGATLASGASPTANVALPVGLNTVELQVEDNAGHVGIDWTFVKVLPQTIYGRYDFDTNLGATFNQNPSPGAFASAGDAFDVKQRNVSLNIPFASLDDTGSAGTGDPNLPECTPFAFDAVGVAACAKQDAFFTAVDIANIDNPNCNSGTVTLTFNISGATDIAVAIDMGASGDFEFADPNEFANFTCDPNNPLAPGDTYGWTYSIDGGAEQPLFVSSVDEAAAPDYIFFSGRTVNIPDPLTMNGTPLSNVMRTLVAPVTGTGSTLTLKLTAIGDGGEEAYVFDDVIVMESVVVPTCPGDVDGDGDTDIDDLLLLLGAFGVGGGGDLDGDNDTDIDDLLILLGDLGCA